VQRVRACLSVLEGFEGRIRNYFLRIQHDNDSSRDLSRRGEYLAVGQPVHFDIARINVADQGGYDFIFTYADEAITRMSHVLLLPDQLPTRRRLKIETSGWTDFRDVEPATGTYELVIDESGVLSLLAAG
jgi:hypothetical protein